MAPRTRRSIQRLAAINAEFAQSPLPESTNTHNHDQDISPTQHSKNSTIKAIQMAPQPARAAPRREKQQQSAMDLPVIFSSKSKLTKIDLAKFFSDEKAWTGLTSEQQAILKAMCPPTSAWGKSSMEQPTLGFLLYDMHWKSDVRAYKENMEDGFYDPSWVQAAEKALVKSNDGDFDDWKRQKFEEFWGQKMEPDKVVEDTNRDVTLLDLAMQEKLQINDQWTYRRSFGRGTKMVTVEHRFQMAGVDDYGKVSFRICLPSREPVLKRSSDDMEYGGEGGGIQLEGRSRSTKHVKIALEDLISDQQQLAEPQTQTLPIVDQPENSENIDIKVVSTDTMMQQHQTSGNTDSTSPEDDLSEPAPLRNIPRAVVTLPKSILKKPSMGTFFMITTEPEDLERQVLQHDGRDLKLGKTDIWKLFSIRRNGQDIGSLHDLRNELLKEKA